MNPKTARLGDRKKFLDHVSCGIENTYGYIERSIGLVESGDHTSICHWNMVYSVSRYGDRIIGKALDRGETQTTIPEWTEYVWEVRSND